MSVLLRREKENRLRGPFLRLARHPVVQMYFPRNGPGAQQLPFALSTPFKIRVRL